VGAGPAGLTAAEALREKGYRNMVILEKEAAAGGKCHTIEIDGRNYEMGAGIIASGNTTIMGLVEKYGVALSPVVFSGENLYDPATGGLSKDTFSLPEKISYFWQLLLRYRRQLARLPGVQLPGHLDVEAELYDNFHHWAKAHHIPLVEDRFERFFTGFGYGYWEDIPAAYTLKYYDWPSLVSFLRKEIYTFPEGIQELWKKIAAGYEVHYDSPVKRISRNGEGILAEAGGRSFQADVLLLACPLDDSLAFIDAGEQETALFSKIQYMDYRTYVCRVSDFPRQTGFIPSHFHPSKKGHPVFWYKRYTDDDLYTFYVLSDFSVTDDVIAQNLEDAIGKLGGHLNKLELVLKWKYFPHVGTGDMQEGFYQQLEALQGVKNTYYLGEIMNFSTVELSAAYSRGLVGRFF